MLGNIIVEMGRLLASASLRTVSTGPPFSGGGGGGLLFTSCIESLMMVTGEIRSQDPNRTVILRFCVHCCMCVCRSTHMSVCVCVCGVMLDFFPVFGFLGLEWNDGTSPAENLDSVIRVSMFARATVGI